MLQQQIAALSKQQQADESVEEYAADARTRLANLGYNANQQMTFAPYCFEFQAAVHSPPLGRQSLVFRSSKGTILKL